MTQTQQYIFLPGDSLKTTERSDQKEYLTQFLLGVEPLRMIRAPGRVRDSDAPRDLKLRVIDSIHEDGAKLVEMPPQSVAALRQFQPGLRIVPLVYYRPAIAPMPEVASRPRSASTRKSASMTVRVTSAGDGSGIRGARVVAFTDFAQRVGDDATTDENGEAHLRLGAATRRKIDRLYVYPKKTFWGALLRSFTLIDGRTVRLTPIDLGYTDVLRHFYPAHGESVGESITVGVIDTGVGPHKDLSVAGGENTVPGEDPANYGDNGKSHGTHVAGIIAGKGMPPQGMCGIARGVTLRSYRVFPQDSEEGSNYAIAKAIDRAYSDGCDLLNLSLGGGASDEATSLALQDARNAGSVPIVATGNDDRQPVSFPASDDMSIGVSATGRKGTFPRGSVDNGDVARPYGSDKRDFVAAFSNVGRGVDLTGPGVGVISTVPGGYATMSGTSMACPAVVGAAAQILSARPDILGLPRDGTRSDAMVSAILAAGQSLGFGTEYEGNGLIHEASP